MKSTEQVITELQERAGVADRAGDRVLFELLDIAADRLRNYKLMMDATNAVLFG